MVGRLTGIHPSASNTVPATPPRTQPAPLPRCLLTAYNSAPTTPPRAKVALT